MIINHKKISVLIYFSGQKGTGKRNREKFRGRRELDGSVVERMSAKNLGKVNKKLG